MRFYIDCFFFFYFQFCHDEFEKEMYYIFDFLFHEVMFFRKQFPIVHQW